MASSFPQRRKRAQNPARSGAGFVAFQEASIVAKRKAIKPGSPADRAMEKRMGMKPGSAADMKMEKAGGMKPSRKKGY